MPLHLKRSDASSVCLPSILSPRRSATDICISLNFTPPLYFCCCVIWDQRKRYESLQQLGIEGNTPSSRCDKKEEWNLSASFLKSMSIIHWDNLHLPGRRGVSLLTQVPVLTGVWCGLWYCMMLSPDCQAFHVWPQPSTNWQVTNTWPGCFEFWQHCTNPSANGGWLSWFIITPLSSSFFDWLIEDWSLNWWNTMQGLTVWSDQRRISQKKKEKDLVKQFASEGKVDGYIGKRGSPAV